MDIDIMLADGGMAKEPLKTWIGKTLVRAFSSLRERGQVRYLDRQAIVGL